MKIRIHAIDDEMIVVPMCIYMIAFCCQYGYGARYNKIGVPTNQEDWGLFIAVLLIGLFLMGKSYTISEAGVEVNRLFGLIRRSYKWEEFRYAGCRLNVDKEKANLNDPNDYVIFLKRRKPRLSYEWYLRIVSECCLPCCPALYLMIEAMICRFDKPLPFLVKAPSEKISCGSNALEKWHFACLGYALFCLMASVLTMCYELKFALDVIIWGIVIGYLIIWFKKRTRHQELLEERCHQLYEILKEHKQTA